MMKRNKQNKRSSKREESPYLVNYLADPFPFFPHPHDTEKDAGLQYAVQHDYLKNMCAVPFATGWVVVVMGMIKSLRRAFMFVC
jgi:hypothetical protein